MKIGFNIEITTSRELDRMALDDLKEYLSIMLEMRDMFQKEVDYVGHIIDKKHT